VDHIHLTYFYGIRQMRMKDRSFIDKINPTFIALTVVATHHYLSALKTGEFRVPPDVGAGVGAQVNTIHETFITRLILHAQMYFHHLDPDFRSSLPQVQAKKIDNIGSIIRQRIHSTGTDLAIAQPHNNLGSFDEDILDDVPEKPIEQPNNSFSGLSNFVAATAASMPSSAVLPMGGSAIASSSQPLPSSNSNSNSSDITNMTSIENTGLVDGSTIVEGAMLLGG